MIFMMGSKITGFLRETALAWSFGRTAVTDAYKAAFDLPCLILSVVVTAISASFIPVYEQQQKSRDEGKGFVRNLFSIGFAVSVLITILTALCLTPLVKIMGLPPKRKLYRNPYITAADLCKDRESADQKSGEKKHG